MYKVSFEVIVPESDMARALEDHIRRMGIHIDRYNMEFIDEMRGVAEAPPIAMPSHIRNQYQELLAKYTEDLKNDQILRDLLEVETEEFKDFLDEKDMEI